MDKTLFIVFGIILVVSAVAVAAVGLRDERFPATRIALAGLIAYFVVLVAATTTFAVLQASKSDERAHNAAAAASAAQAGGAAAAGGATTSTTTQAQGTTTTGGGAAKTVDVSASPTAIAYQQKSLQAKAGKVSFQFSNPGAVQHNFCLESTSGQQLGCSGTIAQSSDSLDVSVQSGKYTFYCNVDGHRAAGMQGTLTVK